MTDAGLHTLFLDFLNKPEVRQCIDEMVAMADELDLPGMELAIRWNYGADDTPIRIALRIGDLKNEEMTRKQKAF